MHQRRGRGEEERCAFVSMWRETSLVGLLQLLSEVRDASLLLCDGALPVAQLAVESLDCQLVLFQCDPKLSFSKDYRLLQSADFVSALAVQLMHVRQAETESVCVDQRRLLCVE